MATGESWASSVVGPEPLASVDFTRTFTGSEGGDGHSNGNALPGCVLGFTAEYFGPEPAESWGLEVWITIYLYVPVGVVCGLIGGVIYGLNQRLLTAASLCVGVLGSGIVAAGVYGISESPVHWVWQIVGGLLGILYTVLSWRREVRH